MQITMTMTMTMKMKKCLFGLVLPCLRGAAAMFRRGFSERANVPRRKRRGRKRRGWRELRGSKSTWYTGGASSMIRSLAALRLTRWLVCVPLPLDCRVLRDLGWGPWAQGEMKMKMKMKMATETHWVVA